LPKNKKPSILKQFKNFEPAKLDYSYQKAISYSQMSTYLSCKHKWELQYKDQHFVYSPSIHACFGSALHSTIQHFISTLYEQSGVAASRIDINSYFEEEFRKQYLVDYNKNKKIHFSTPDEMREFCEDGYAILDFLNKKKGLYFSKRGWHLVGIELPILITPNLKYNSIKFKGYIDVVLYHEKTNKFKIIDIKTSTQGWKAKDKADQTKLYQLLLYKHYFSNQFHIPIEDIEIEFFIVKRKLWEDSPFPLKRVQLFVPVSGKTKINKAVTTVDDFISDVFDREGKYVDKKYEVSPSEWNCRFCAFSKDKSLCPEAFSK